MDVHPLAPEEQARADLYSLLAALLLGPEPPLVRALATLAGAGELDGPLAAPWQDLLAAAARLDGGVQAEHQALFVAVGTPRINPYRCWYVDGWLMDKPLAGLRGDLAELGLARAQGASELEDHLGALCEAMRLLVQRRAPAGTQQAFFARHLAGWSVRCLHDIAAAPDADFFRAAAALAEAFFALEAELLEVETTSFDPAPPARHPLTHATHPPA